MPAKLRCFAAMAFGQKDTDAIFKILRRTLAPLGINAQRVDRIEHNDNIDTRIISEIEAADLVIADLTYARPSVYFEAGYAQRAIPACPLRSQDAQHHRLVIAERRDISGTTDKACYEGDRPAGAEQGRQ
jgi:nucleoside 2-deoxyribosyltransferase